MVKQRVLCYTTVSSSCCAHYVCVDACMAHKNRGVWDSWNMLAFPENYLHLDALWSLLKHWGHFGVIMGQSESNKGGCSKARKESDTLIIKIVWCNNECFTTAQVQQSCVQKSQVCSVDLETNCVYNNLSMHNIVSTGGFTATGVFTKPGVSTAVGISTATGVSTDPGQTDNSPSNIVMVAGVAVSVIVLVFAVVCILVLVVWWR